jgi:hypothetical protein
LAARGRIRTSRVLYASAFILLFGFFCRMAIEEKWGWAIPIIFFGSYGLHATYKFFLTAETSRQLNEDLRSGALELILVTPLNVAHLVRAQLYATWRAWVPMGVCVALMNFTWLSHREFRNQPVFESALWISIILLLADTIVLPWRAVLTALNGERYHITVFKTFTRTMGPPAALFAFMAVYSIGISDDRFIATIFQLWALFTIVFNVFMLVDARSRLKNLRRLASGERIHPRWSPQHLALQRRRFPLPIPANRA